MAITRLINGVWTDVDFPSTWFRLINGVWVQGQSTTKFALTEITFDADGTIAAEVRHDAGTGTPFYTHANDSSTGSSADYVENDDSETTTTAWFSLANVDSDFDSLESLTLSVDVEATTFSDDTCTLTARIYDADNDTTNALTDSQTIATEADGTRLQRTVSFGSLTGTKAQWDSAYCLLTWTYAKSAGPDNANIRLYGCEFNGSYTASAGGGSQTVAPSLITENETLFAPAVAPGDATVVPTLITENETLFGPVAAPGAVTGIPTLITENETLFAPAVAPGAASITPTLITENESLFAPATGGSQPIVPTLITENETLFAPAVAPGDATIVPTLITENETLFAPAVAPGDATIVPTLITENESLFAPVVAPGDATIVPTLITENESLFAPVVAPGDATIVPTLITENESLFNVPPVTGELIVPTLITENETLFAPAVAPGEVTAPPSLISELEYLFAPAVGSGDDEVEQGGGGGKRSHGAVVLPRRPRLQPDEALVFGLTDEEAAAIAVLAIEMFYD